MSKRLFPSKVAGSNPLPRFLPVMIARLMISLKKATMKQDAWSFGEPTMKFAEPRPVVTTFDEIRLDTFTTMSAFARSRA